MERLTILFSGMMARKPDQGGAAWAVLQYLLGFQDLGHDVYLVEPIDGPISPLQAAAFTATGKQFGLQGALITTGTRETSGMEYSELKQVARKADLVINISGMLKEPELIGPVPLRVYLDLDPAFNQLWSEAEHIDVGFNGHNRFVTVGLNVASEGNLIPTCGREWITTLPPIVLNQWPRSDRILLDQFTTVAHWRAYGSITWKGLHFGQKAHSLRPLFELPNKTEQKLGLALSIHPDETADLEALHQGGWTLFNPDEVTGSPNQYRDFIRSSKAEFGVAKSGYVTSRSGWFSDRSVCYLASGRPVVAQDTGFADHLPIGEGLFKFADESEALAAIEAVASEYPRHASAARSLAEDLFDSRIVLPRLIEQLQ